MAWKEPRRRQDTWGGPRKKGREGAASRVTIAFKAPREVRMALEHRAEEHCTTVSSLMLEAAELLLLLGAPEGGDNG